MNRSKRPISNALRKKMKKEIRLGQSSYPVPESRQYSDELTAKEMLKKYPKKVAKKQKELLQASEKRIAIKKKKLHKVTSKRTTPGKVPGEFPHDYSQPAIVHKEGRRWIKTLTKQTLAQRAIQAHKGGRKK